MHQLNNIQDIKGKRFSVIGGEHGTVAIARLLRLMGANIFVSEKKPVNNVKRTAEELEKLGAQYEFSGYTDKVFNADYLVVSPGVPSNAYIVRKAKSVGLRVLSEVEVASWFCRAPIVAITGSNGKTTTTSLIGTIFQRAQIPFVIAGNITLPLSDFVFDVDTHGAAIMGVTCFQLEDIDRFRPKVAVLTNIIPDQLDRYDDFDEYIASKGRIFKNQTEEDVLIYNDDDEVVRRLSAGAKSKRLPFSVKHKVDEGAYLDQNNLVCNLNRSKENIVSMDEIKIRGTHNLYNSLAATLAARAFDIKNEIIRDGLSTFEGVAHRLEFVRDLGGVRYFNDSKATNVNSVWYALESFNEPIVLIAGGRDKGNDYSKLYQVVKSGVKAMVLIGEASERMYLEFQDKTRTLMAGSMEDAIERASDVARPGDVVLLSPACASFDMFDNYEHRGEVFKRLVNTLQK